MQKAESITFTGKQGKRVANGSSTSQGNALVFHIPGIDVAMALPERRF